MVKPLVSMPDIGAGAATENDCGTGLLVLEDVSVCAHFLAATISVAALEFNFC